MHSATVVKLLETSGLNSLFVYVIHQVHLGLSYPITHSLLQNRSGIILRAGMILKNDQWRTSTDDHEPTIRGAINFRRVPASSLYALSQPTQDGIVRVLQTVREKMKYEDGSINWLNLREEPLIYVK